MLKGGSSSRQIGSHQMVLKGLHFSIKAGHMALLFASLSTTNNPKSATVPL